MFIRIAGFVIGLLLLIVTPALAQLQLRPTDPPRVTAVNEPWYVQREPIDLGGDLYYRAGPSVFFDGNVMARIGYYNGVPIYMDTTIEPYSVILVPIRRGLMQQYERRRSGSLAGTTASRTPSFPVRAVPEGSGLLEAGAPPTMARESIGAMGAVPRREPEASALERSTGTSGTPPVERPAAALPSRNDRSIASVSQPNGNDGLWIAYAGEKWVNAGAAVPLRAREFRMVGQYAGFPVFVRSGDEKTIYIPTRAGLVAPYRVKPQ